MKTRLQEDSIRGTENVNNSLKKFSSKRKKRNGLVAGLGNGVQRRESGVCVYVCFRNKSVSQRMGKWIMQESRELL